MTGTLFLLDPNLKDLVGHYFEYDRSIAEAALKRGMNCVVLSHAEAKLPENFPIEVSPTYSGDIWKTFPGESYHSDRNLTATNGDFAAETRAVFAKRTPVSGDTIFIPTLTKAQLLGAVEIGEEYGARGVRTEIMLRYPRVFFDGPVAARAFRRLEEASAQGIRIGLCTDSDRLAEDLGRLTSAPIRVFPIPHASSHGLSAVGDREQPVHFVSLGNARGEKGLQEIFGAITALRKTPWARRARFTLQVNNPSSDIKAQIRDMAARNYEGVTLIQEPLDSDAYYALLREADVVLLPYHRNIYAERTSGVFLEATTAGKVIICTKDTWMSDLQAVHGGGVAIKDKSVRELTSAIKSVITDLGAYQTNALEAGELWRAVHTPDRLLDHLTADAVSESQRRQRKRAAVFFPWGDLLKGKSGAAVRLRLLVKVLEQRYDEVRVLYLSAGEPGGMLTARTAAEPYLYKTLKNWALLLVLGAIAAAACGKPSKAFHLWYHIWPRRDRAYRQRCDDLVRWADDVFVEYSYSAPLVSDACNRLRKSFVLTQHDIVSEQSRGVPFIYRETKAREFGAIKMAPRVFVATEADRDLCRAEGVEAEIAPHPIDLDDLVALSPEETAFIVKEFYGVPAARPICFFVGSSYQPNREAAEFIFRLAAEARQKGGPDVTFVVAGACMDRRREDNFVSLGPIESIALAAFYKRAALILTPLAEGTGSSIKSVEALAHGAAVLSSTIGMRGIPVEDGVNCFIEDKRESYLARIAALLAASDLLDKVRAGARALGARYDYRQVFAAYPLPPLKADIVETPPDSSHRFIELLPRAQKLNNPRAVEFACGVERS